MASSMTQAQPPLAFIPPDFSPLVWWMARSLLPFRLRQTCGIADIQIANIEQLVTLYHQFEQGNVRFLLAFRHPTTHDPDCLFYLLSHALPKAAKRQGVPLSPQTHAHFIYDRGIPLWAGGYVGWLYSKLGGIPIRRGRADTTSLRVIRQKFASGAFPIAAAPEGANNGHNEVVAPIEPGIAQFGFWCAEDLAKAADCSETGMKPTPPVLIVPIGVQYRYLSPPWRQMEQLLRQLERDAGLTSPSHAPAFLQDGTDPTEAQKTNLYRRLFRLGEHLLRLMEHYYDKFYQAGVAVQKGAPTHASSSTDDQVTLSNEEFSRRLQALMDTALTVAEQFFGLPSKGNVPDRCRRLEQAAWDRIFREDLKDLDVISAVERGLADRVAEEADLRIWHMRLVETFVSVTGNYVREKPSAERFGETLILVWDMVSRLKGKSPFPYPKLGQRRAFLTVGEPLSVSDRLPAYRSNRRQAVTTLTQDLQSALEAMIQS
ncbi:1-acyl-sn-glycerol-3-phosphate acyltransferase [Vacuolonema iberomarrocanum]|uniref:1-acyl-sn-glycerol-3-phosphate acyltransferase n=1 Tax=Vacuolonema iberomarrocanum TaxID=3454632 RepID=UPI001A10792A|nr:1-acyl-sn-glycerol-3-phosphate acyltransferase [filamentous cyanobacterium LEGE 07170]